MRELLPSRYLLALMILIGCGVTVGNSGPPPATDDAEVATLAAMEHDEVMNAAVDQNANDTSEALAFASDPVFTSACTEDAATGGLLVERSEKLDISFEAGKQAKRRVITEGLARNWNIKLALASGTGVLKCGANNKPALTLGQLVNLKSEETVTRERNRSVVLKADQSVVSETSLSASSKRTHAFAKVSGSLISGALVFSKTSSFESTVTLKKDGDETAKEKNIQTLANEPLVLEKTWQRGSGLTAARIVSGAVATVSDDKRKVVLRYSNLQLGVGASCHPTSGTIAGEIYADETATTASSTFTLKFTEDGAVLVLADGTEQDLELEVCQL